MKRESARNSSGSAGANVLLRAVLGLRAARLAWWTEWPFEKKSSWLRGLRLLEEFKTSGGFDGARTQPRPLPENARILIIRLGHLGDILHTIPFARAIKRQRPDVKIELLAGPWTEKLAGRFECFDSVIAYAPDFVQFHRGDRSRVLPFQQERKFLRDIRARRYHAVVTTSPTHLADQVVLCAANAQMAVGAKGGLPDVSAAVADFRRAFNSRQREADWVSSFLPDLGLEIEDAPLSFPLEDAEKKRAEELLAQIPAPRVAIAPGSGWPGKCWPVERFAGLALRLQAKFGTGIVAVGSREEKPLVDEMNSHLQAPVLNLAGETSLGESAAIIAACALFIGNDSAPLHFAAAAGVPTLSFFGPTSPSKWSPPGPRNRVLQLPGLCEGCVYWHCLAACVHENFCMNSITVEAAFDAASELLREV